MTWTNNMHRHCIPLSVNFHWTYKWGMSSRAQRCPKQTRENIILYGLPEDNWTAWDVHSKSPSDVASMVNLVFRTFSTNYLLVSGHSWLQHPLIRHAWTLQEVRQHRSSMGARIIYSFDMLFLVAHTTPTKTQVKNCNKKHEANLNYPFWTAGDHLASHPISPHHLESFERGAC